MGGNSRLLSSSIRQGNRTSWVLKTWRIVGAIKPFWWRKEAVLSTSAETDGVTMFSLANKGNIHLLLPKTLNIWIYLRYFDGCFLEDDALGPDEALAPEAKSAFAFAAGLAVSGESLEAGAEPLDTPLTGCEGSDEEVGESSKIEATKVSSWKGKNKVKCKRDMFYPLFLL